MVVGPRIAEVAVSLLSKSNQIVKPYFLIYSAKLLVYTSCDVSSSFTLKPPWFSPISG